MIVKNGNGNGNGKTKSNSKPLKIYLADPVHQFIESSDIWTIPLNVLTIASYAKAAFGEKIDVKVLIIALKWGSLDVQSPKIKILLGINNKIATTIGTIIEIEMIKFLYRFSFFILTSIF